MSTSLIVFLIIVVAISLGGSIFLLALARKLRKNEKEKERTTSDKIVPQTEAAERPKNIPRMLIAGLVITIIAILGIVEYSIFKKSLPLFIAFNVLLIIYFIRIPVSAIKKRHADRIRIAAKPSGLPPSIGKAFIPVLIVWLLFVNFLMITELLAKKISTFPASVIGIPTLNIIIGELLAITICLAIIMPIRRNRKLLKSNYRSQMKIVEVTEGWGRRKVKRTYRVLCYGINPRTGEAEKYRSPALYGDPREYMKTNQIHTMPVCFDHTGKRNYMDITSIAEKPVL